MKTEDKSQNWTKPDKDGNIHVPEELEPLFNKLICREYIDIIINLNK